jgi:FtsZ-binding cell division protein ZapB
LSMEYLSELEKKVDILIKNLERLKQENAKLKEDELQKTDELEKIKGANSSLQNDLDRIRSDTKAHRDKLDAATDKIKSLIARIDAA